MDKSTFNSADKENDAQGKEEAAKRFSEHIPPKPQRPILKEILPSDAASASSQDLSNTVAEENKEIIFETVNTSTVFDSFMSTSESYDPFSSIVIEGTDSHTRNLEELSLHDSTAKEDMYYLMDTVKKSQSLISADESVSEPAVQEKRKSDNKMSMASECLDASNTPLEISPLEQAQSPIQQTMEYAKSDMTILADALGEVCLDSSYDSIRVKSSSNSRQSSETSQIHRNSTFDWDIPCNQNLRHSGSLSVSQSESTLSDNSRMAPVASFNTKPQKVAVSDQLKSDQELVQLKADEGSAKEMRSTSTFVQISGKMSLSEVQTNTTFQANFCALEEETNDPQPALPNVNKQSLNESGKKEMFMVNLKLRKFRDNEASESSEIIESTNSSENTILGKSSLLESTNTSSMSPGTKQVTSEFLNCSSNIAEKLKKESDKSLMNPDPSPEGVDKLKEDCMINSEACKSQPIELNDNLGKNPLKSLDNQQNYSISLQETTEAACNHKASVNIIFNGSYGKNNSEPRSPIVNHRSINSEHLEESKELSRPDSNICDLTESLNEILQDNLNPLNPLEHDHPTEGKESSNDNLTVEFSSELSKKQFKTQQQNDALNLTQEKQEGNTSDENVDTTNEFDITHNIGDLAEMENDVGAVNISPSTPLSDAIPSSNEDSSNTVLSTELSAESYKDASESDHQIETWNLPQEKLAESISDNSANATYKSNIKAICENTRSEGSALNSTFNANDSVVEFPLETSKTRLESDLQVASSTTFNVAIMNISSKSVKEMESNNIKNDESSVIYIADDSNSEKALEHLAKSMNQTIDVEVSAIVEDVISVDTSSDSSATSNSLERGSLSTGETKLENDKTATISQLLPDKIIDLTESVSTEEVVGEVVTAEEISINHAEKTEKDQPLSGDLKECVDGKNGFTLASFETTKEAKPQLTIPKKIQCRPNLRTVRNKTRVILNPLVVKGDTNAEVVEDNDNTDPLVEQYKKQEEELSKDLARLQKELGAMHEDNMLKDKCILSHALDREANKDKICRYKDVIQQYEAQLKKQCSDMLALKQESQKLAHDFSSSEMAFADLFRKYERAKEVIGVFKNNEAILIENNEIATSQIEELEIKHKALKTECDDIIKRAQERVKLETDQNQQKIIRLQNKVKKLKIEASSLDVALKQKTEECAALAALCDDITSK
ncbi:serine-rich adhesin for platelets-like isoform X2 [Euwallacea fornicatus]|uniref:serine-rich adhesin for platelets-like isoform X2 n=1 Tax=Euwallacea fornicatus TaxID=995702 RepID=UPI00338F69CF